MKKVWMALFAALLLTGCSAQAQMEQTVPETTIPATTQVAESTDTQPEETQPPLIPGSALKDGTYSITVDSSASMFRVVHCELTVKDGKMTAAMTMSGKGYGMVYPGTAEEALADSEDQYIPFELDAEGHKVFTVVVEALNQEQPCAAWSIRKEKWYDRTLIFEASELPPEAYVQE